MSRILRRKALMEFMNNIEETLSSCVNEKMVSLSKYYELRRNYDNLVEIAMHAAFMHIDLVRNSNIGAKRLLYAFIFETMHECSICCTTLITQNMDDILTKVLNKPHSGAITTFPYELSTDDVDKIFRNDIYNWLKKVYPQCGLTLTKESCPSPFEKYGSVLIYRYVL